MAKKELPLSDLTYLRDELDEKYLRFIDQFDYNILSPLEEGEEVEGTLRADFIDSLLQVIKVLEVIDHEMVLEE